MSAIAQIHSAKATPAAFIPVWLPACRHPTVLLVEDDPDVSAIMSLLLTDGGFEVSTAWSGPEGLSRARNFAPDIVVLDVNLPGMNGLEICRQLKASPETCGLPVVFCSGERDLAGEAVNLGAAAFLTKPDDILKLADCLHAKLCRT